MPKKLLGWSRSWLERAGKGFSWLHWTDFKPENHWGELHPCSLVDECWWYWKTENMQVVWTKLFIKFIHGIFQWISHSSKRQRTESSWMLGDSHLSGLLNEATPQQAGDTHWPFLSCEFPIEHGDFLAGFPQDFTRHDTDEDQKISEL